MRFGRLPGPARGGIISEAALAALLGPLPTNALAGTACGSVHRSLILFRQCFEARDDVEHFLGDRLLPALVVVHRKR